MTIPVSCHLVIRPTFRSTSSYQADLATNYRPVGDNENTVIHSWSRRPIQAYNESRHAMIIGSGNSHKDEPTTSHPPKQISSSNPVPAHAIKPRPFILHENFQQSRDRGI